MEHWVLFGEERNNIRELIVNNTYNNIWLNFSDKLTATKRYNLELCNYFVLAKKFDELIWKQTEKMVPGKKWSCEEVKNWVIYIEGMPDGLGPTLLGCHSGNAAERF